jgi:DNA-binding NtrC family response regulator
LVCTADRSRGDALLALLARHGLIGRVAPTEPQALDCLDRNPRLALLIVDTDVQHPDGASLLLAARQVRSDVGVIILSDTPSIRAATEAIRRGAEDFVPFPCSDDALMGSITRALGASTQGAPAGLPISRTTDDDQLAALSSLAPAMTRPLELARAAMRSDTPVLIVGETGTGKERLARAIHASSPRAARAFVPVNCTALPADLLESELFGHRRGAFTGAVSDHRGLFLAANRGTIFLDEIADLPRAAQPKLLRVLQDGEIRPVGGLDRVRVDARIIAATNRTIREMHDGAMRDDLFYRLTILVIELPPLRLRREDLPELVPRLLARFQSNARRCSITHEALDLIRELPFPGNIRQLENLLQAGVALLPTHRDTLTRHDIAQLVTPDHRTPDVAFDFHPEALRLSTLEQRAIGAALNRSGGNKTRAAELLGISRDTLYRKLKEFADEPELRPTF